MMKASLNAKYDPKKAATTGCAAIALNAGEIKLRASMTEATVINGLSLNGLVFAVEKPDSFIFDYKVSEKASLRARYETDKAAATGGAGVAFNASDFKLRASMTNATVVNGLSLNGLVFAVEKPGSFIFNYDVPKKDFKFQFMNSIRVLEKPLNLKYTHSVRVLDRPVNNDSKGDNRTILDGTLVLDSANKVSANHVLGSGGCKLKYSYVYGELTTFEPSYDTTENSWDFAVSHKVYGDNVCKAMYQTKSNDLGLEWSRSSKRNGSFKVCACLCLNDMERKWPKLTAESSWDFDI